jgi:hypothetical protein
MKVRGSYAFITAKKATSATFYCVDTTGAPSSEWSDWEAAQLAELTQELRRKLGDPVFPVGQVVCSKVQSIVYPQYDTTLTNQVVCSKERLGRLLNGRKDGGDDGGGDDDDDVGGGGSGGGDGGSDDDDSDGGSGFRHSGSVLSQRTTGGCQIDWTVALREFRSEKVFDKADSSRYP